MFSSEMGDNLVTADTVSNPRPVSRTKQGVNSESATNFGLWLIV